MTKVTELHDQWIGDSEYQKAYKELAPELGVASAVIAARNHAGLTQEELAKRMDAKQSLVAKLESGAQNTTIKTLERIAEATGTQLKISFE